MRSGFFNGVLLGALAGAVMSIYYYPKMKPTPQRFILRRSRGIGKRAGRFMWSMTRDVQGLLNRQR